MNLINVFSALMLYSTAVSAGPVPFSDVINTNKTSSLNGTLPAVANITYPKTPSHEKTVHNLINTINPSRLQRTMKSLTSFHNRYFDSGTGVAASDWVYEEVEKMKGGSGSSSRFEVEVVRVKHDFPQRSVEVRISPPGTEGGKKKKKENVIVVGAHLDSINVGVKNRTEGKAPGADDNASGVATLLEALHILLHSGITRRFKNRIHFHFYAGEEIGLKGSDDIFKSYRQGRKWDSVVAALNQDMTGYKLPTGQKEDHFFVMRDNTFGPLNVFVKGIIEEYCSIGWDEAECGYACSDHASMTRYGFPAAWVTHNGIHDRSWIHTEGDSLEIIDYGHMAEHVKLVLAFVVELGFARF